MKKLWLSILLFILLIIPAAGKDNSDWEHIAPNNYVYKDGITGLENMYGYSFLLKSYNKGQYEPVNGKQVHYTLGQYEINCAKRTYKIGVLDSYDENDIFINGDYNKYAQFQPVVEGTAIYVMTTKLCKFK
ncbi:hypothetical protein J6I39_00790 [bacterium]|nr:hypothetical protein [bacterium]